MNNKTDNPAEIYLVPLEGEEHDHVWSDTPAPDEGMREEDAARYVREDLMPESNAVLAERIAELTKKLSHHDYVIAQSENATGILCGNDMPGNSPLVLMARKAMRENAELKAQVEQLKNLFSPKVLKIIRHGIRSVYAHDVSEDLISELHDPIQSAIESLPAQCLSEIKAQAVEEALRMVYHEEDDHRGYYSYEALSAHANQLRQSAKPSGTWLKDSNTHCNAKGE